MIIKIKSVSAAITKNPVIVFAVLFPFLLKAFDYLFGLNEASRFLEYYISAALGVMLLFASVRAAMFFRFFSHLPYVLIIKEDAHALAILLGSIFIGIAIIIGFILTA